MTNEEIDKDARKLVELVEKYGAEYGALVIADLIRCFAAQAYEEAIKAVCTCYSGSEGREHQNFCAARKIAALKDSLAAVSASS